MKYEFKCTHYDGSEVIHRFEAVTQSEVVEHLISFMRGCGFVMPASDGWLEFAEEFSNSPEEVK